jgi:hypothetical protein
VKCAGPEVKVWRVVTEPFATPDSQYPQSPAFARDREAERRVVQALGVGIKYCEAMTFVHECKTARFLVSLSPRAAPQQHKTSFHCRGPTASGTHHMLAG